MNPKLQAKLEQASYPTGTTAPLGQHLRILARNEEAYVPPLRPRPLSSKRYAIVVPTCRDVLKNHKSIRRIMQLAVAREAVLVFLCSGMATKEDIQHIAKEVSSLQWAALDGPFSPKQPGQNFETTRSPLAYGDEKDIAQKRNVALQLARVMGWEMIVFLDDDIAVTPAQLDKAVDLLLYSNAAVVGFNARQYPDLSVVMHAHRWLHGSIDTFLGAGIMAINTTAPFLSFFPHIYNEDWLFVLPHSLWRKENVVWAGSVQQAAYNPFKNPQRAHSEEAGDLLAESLFKLAIALRGSGRRFKTPESALSALVEHANEAFWSAEINNRLTFLHGLLKDLKRKHLHPIQKYRATKSLLQAVERIEGKDGKGGITASDLASWMHAWHQDALRWNRPKTPRKAAASLATALKSLKMSNSFIDHIDSARLSEKAKP